MIIAATADIHSPIGFKLFVRSLDNLKAEPDLFLIAGDLIHKGEISELKKIVNATFGRISCPIICCFGNNEYQNLREKIIKEHKEFIFLDDEIYETKINGKKISILGTQGSLDRPTPWQSTNLPNIETVYRERIELIGDCLSSSKADFKILLIHYPPTYKIMTGETHSSFPFLGSNQLEAVLTENRPDIVITGHAHTGKKIVWIDSTPVFNAGLKLNEKILIIDTEKLKPGLEKFLT